MKETPKTKRPYIDYDTWKQLQLIMLEEELPTPDAAINYLINRNKIMENELEKIKLAGLQGGIMRGEMVFYPQEGEA